MRIDYKGIGRRIAKKRNELNMTQEDLADKLQTSPSYISNIENGVYGVSFERFIKIGQELNVSYDYLLNSELRQVHLKTDAKWNEVLNLINELDEKNQEKAFLYIESFIKTMKNIEK